MRIFYSFVFLLIAVAFNANGQIREDNDIQQGPFNSKSVHIFPNPAVDFVHVRLEKALARQVVLTLHNILGNEMKVESEIVDEHEIRIRVKDLDAGYYFIALKDDPGHFKGTYKFLKR